MGTDPMAVVDPQLRVRGLVGVRVVDCSIMPTIVSSNTHAPAVMIGEMAARFLAGICQSRSIGPEVDNRYPTAKTSILTASGCFAPIPTNNAC
jgi:choline dehydrogenase-like flavoprotein